MLEQNLKYNIILPTHRPEFFKNCLKSILSQTVLPDRLIIINDNYKQTKKLQNLKIRNVEVLYFNSKDFYGSGALNCFKNTFKVLENIPNLEENYFQVMEDDTEYIKTNLIQRIKNLPNKPGLIYLKILDTFSKNLEIPKVNSVRYQPITNMEFSKGLVDTCGIIFNITESQLKEYNSYLKELNYCLNADIYYFTWMYYFALSSNRLTLQFNNYEINSKQHLNQESKNILNQLSNTGNIWYQSLPNKIKRFIPKILKGIKEEVRFLNLYSVLCAYAIIQPKQRIFFDTPKTYKPSLKQTLTKLYRIYNSNKIDPTWFLIQYQELFNTTDILFYLKEILNKYTLEEIGISKEFPEGYRNYIKGTLCQ